MVKKYWVVLIVAVIVVLIFVGNSYLNKKSAAPTQNPYTPGEKSTAGYVNPSATIDAIDTAFLKDKKALGTDLGAYMANSVRVVIYGTAGENRKRDEASRILDSYLKDGNDPWTCDTGDPMQYQNNVVARNLGKANPEFKDALICISSNRYVAAFTYNNEFLIDKIILSSNYKLILP